jgi:ribosome-binding ATPase YchF (GTP1/OBG family)
MAAHPFTTGLREAEIQHILTQLEHYLEQNQERPRALDHIETWDQADIHRLVSLFISFRFPTALALNKCDLPSGQVFSIEIQDSLPIHGAHVGTPMAAAAEMMFVRLHLKNKTTTTHETKGMVSPPTKPG